MSVSCARWGSMRAVHDHQACHACGVGLAETRRSGRCDYCDDDINRVCPACQDLLLAGGCGCAACVGAVGRP